MRKDCNRCNVGARCRGAVNMAQMDSCKRFVSPRDRWKLAELALAHPTGLSKALSALAPINVTGYFKEENNARD